MAHDPQTCEFCGDLAEARYDNPLSLRDFQVHVLAKLAELEGRIQSIEWQTKPLGPGCRPHRETPEEKEALNSLLNQVQKMKSHFRSADGIEGKDFAYRQHVVTDQGNGGAYCGSCSANLDDEYDLCPKCKLPLVEGSLGYSMGGSDF